MNPSMILLILINAVAVVRADNDPHQCTERNYETNSEYDVSLNALLNALSLNIGENWYYTSSVLLNDETVNALALCRGDQTFDQCRKCVHSAALELFEACRNKRQGIVWYDDRCMVRYADNPLHETSDLAYILYNGHKASNPVQFKEDLDRLLEDLRLLAANGSSELKAAGGTRDTADSDSKTIYAMVQCTPDLSPEDCGQCLIQAFDYMQRCCDSQKGVRMLLSDCIVRYELYTFYNETRLREVGALLTPSPLGACYGTQGDNLPPGREVVDLCIKQNIRRIRLYDPNPSVLQALQGQRNISVIVGVANKDIPGIARDAAAAKSWVRNNVLNYKNVNFRYIAVGHEINPLASATSSIAPSVAPAMQNIYDAVSAAGLGSKVKVSTALSMGLVGESYPPSAGVFKSEIRSSFIDPIVQFLVKTNGPFLVSVYPYYAYVNSPNDIHLDYTLFTSPSTVVKDGQYEYQNLFSAMVDAVHAALENAGGGDLQVVVSETGWPTAGGTATSIANARTYTNNAFKTVQTGTPRKPGKPIEAYIYGLFDENRKSNEVGKHWGVFLPSKKPKYPLSFAN